MLSPKIIAIDDDKSHLDALVNGLNNLRLANLPIHYSNDNTDPYEPVPHVRVLFTDLHLLGADEQNTSKHFAVISQLLDELVDLENGPFILVLWTRYSSQASDLKAYLDERLAAKKCPVSVVAINKNKFITADGRLKKNTDLLGAILNATRKNPHLAALIDWEMRALQAAGVTLATVDNLIPDEKRNSKDYSAQLNALLGQLASAAMGHRHAESDKLQAVNQAISPILSDSMVHLPTSKDQKLLWGKAFKDPAKTPNLSVGAQLNRMIHVSTLNDTSSYKDRGVVLKINWRNEKLKQEIGHTQDEILKHFKFKNDGFENDEGLFFLQVQPACDYANRDQKFLPYVLGVTARKGGFSSKKFSGDIYEFPGMELNGQCYVMRISANFLTRFSHTKLRLMPVWFRLREEILNDVTFAVSKQIGRPGIYSFGT